MVRLKHRYLLFHILYPASTLDSRSATGPHDPLHPPTDADADADTASRAEHAQEPLLFLLLHAPSPAGLDAPALMRGFRGAVLDLYGEHGAAAVGAGLKVIYFSPATSTGILRAPRQHVRLVWSALTFLTSLTGARSPPSLPLPPAAAAARNPHPKRAPDESQVVIRVLRNCGTIRLAEREAIARARRVLAAARVAGGDRELLDAFLRPRPDSDGLAGAEPSESEDG